MCSKKTKSPTSKRNSQALKVQMFKKKFATKGKGKKIILQEILEFLKVVTMVDYEVMTSKRDFDDLLEGIDKVTLSLEAL